MLKMGIQTGVWAIKLFRKTLVFLIVAFAWVFFYVLDMKAAVEILRSMFRTNNIGILFSENALNVGEMIGKDWVLLGIGLALLLFVDILICRRGPVCSV